MSFMDAREHGSKPGSGGAASQQNEVSRNSTICKQLCRYSNFSDGYQAPPIRAGHRQKGKAAQARSGDNRLVKGPLLHAQSPGTSEQQPGQTDLNLL